MKRKITQLVIYNVLLRNNLVCCNCWPSYFNNLSVTKISDPLMTVIGIDLIKCICDLSFVKEDCFVLLKCSR